MPRARAVAAGQIAACGVAALALVAGAATLVGAAEGPDRAAAARLAAGPRSGSFSQLNSRAGLAIFTANRLAPGDSASGLVTVTNAGMLAGSFTVSAAELSDAPGPGAGLLSERLRLAVSDVSVPASPGTVYSGPLAAMPPVALGHFRGGEGRTYRFTASLPDGGAPPSPTGGDNAYAGSSARVRFVWTATEAVAPPPGRSPAAPARRAPADRRPPRLRLSIPRVQRVLERRYLSLRARCDEACRLSVGGAVHVGRLRGSLRTPARRAGGGRVTHLRVRLPGRLLGGLRRALLAGRTVTVRLVVTARDSAGNRTVSPRTVRLRKR